MTQKSEAAGRKKQSEKRLELRQQIWGDTLDALDLWDKTVQKGFASVPRTLPQLARIMDRFAGKGTPVSGAYLALLCNVFDHSFLEIRDRQRMSFESGFAGERAVNTWLGRMKKLVELGFIAQKEGMYGEFSYVLILNPFLAVQSLYKNTPKDDLYNALVSRMSDVGTKF
ncbi:MULTISPECIES: hypothetical protein [Aeromonas]|nr:MULTISPECIES: hypothetical protein [Aeromonas]MCX4074644.1 hypothetical protein [Aeromonas caviae]MCX4106630.1 hypothetical protein [Aeromonas hydrophila]NJI10726.1 hypothetical protein [Aeromonas veronii]WMJ07203.1 hypothetical protein RBH93_21575 [Aeromonas veronii]